LESYCYHISSSEQKYGEQMTKRKPVHKPKDRLKGNCCICKKKGYTLKDMKLYCQRCYTKIKYGGYTIEELKFLFKKNHYIFKDPFKKNHYEEKKIFIR